MKKIIYIIIPIFAIIGCKKDTFPTNIVGTWKLNSGSITNTNIDILDNNSTKGIYSAEYTSANMTSTERNEDYQGSVLTNYAETKTNNSYSLVLKINSDGSYTYSYSSTIISQTEADMSNPTPVSNPSVIGDGQKSELSDNWSFQKLSSGKNVLTLDGFGEFEVVSHSSNALELANTTINNTKTIIPISSSNNTTGTENNLKFNLKFSK